MDSKVASGAVVFLAIFVIIHGLLDSEFKEKHQPMFTAFAISRMLIFALIYESN